MINFPDSPTLGQVFTSGSLSWSWDGVKWGVSGASGSFAPLASPTFTGDPKAPTPTAGDNDTSIATTAFVKAQNYVTGGPYAPLASPALTGTPIAPTASNSTSTTQIATTAFVRIGTATNDSAAAGQVGEFVSALVTTGIALPDSTATAIASISLSPGDWDVSAEMRIGGGTGSSLVAATINNVSGILPVGVPALNTAVAELAVVASTESVVWMSLGPCRQSLGVTTTIYLNAQQNGGTGYTGTGKLTARRAR